jgi:lycopene beta-cyclase
MAACFGITLPLEFVFRARVYRRPRRLLRAMAVPVGLFVLWDVIAISRGTWWFSDRYTTGWHVGFGLPVEEVVFFIIIPICALLTYESVSNVLSGRADRRRSRG